MSLDTKNLSSIFLIRLIRILHFIANMLIAYARLGKQLQHETLLFSGIDDLICIIGV